MLYQPNRTNAPASPDARRHRGAETAASKPSLWKRICLFRKTANAHLKLFRMRGKIRKLCEASNDGECKGFKKVISELHAIISSGRGFPVRELVPDYFVYHLQYKGARLDDYVFMGEWLRYFLPMNASADSGVTSGIFGDKLAQWRFFTKNNIPTTKRFGCIEWKGQTAYVRQDGAPAANLLRDVLEQEGKLFCKPKDGEQGKGCILLAYDGNSLLANDEKITDNEKLAARLPSGYMVEGVIRQHPGLSALHTGSVNTLRLATMRDADGMPTLIARCLRIGVGEMHVDNWSAGGLVVGISEQGTLVRTAYTEEYINNAYEVHPDSDIRFLGYEIPYFRDAVQTVLRAHKLFPNLFSAGWDVAITETGPCIIEVNLHYGIHTIQLAGCGLRHVYNAMLRPSAIKAGVE